MHDGAALAHARRLEPDRARPEIVEEANAGAEEQRSDVEVELAPGRERVGPLVQAFAALAQRLSEGLVRPGDETVERHRDLERQSCHVVSPLFVFQMRDRTAWRNSSRNSARSCGSLGSARR